MEEVKQKILGFNDWDTRKKARAVRRLNHGNIENFTGLPDDVHRAALDEELSERAVSMSIDAKLDRVIDILESKEVKRFRFSQGKSGISQAVNSALSELDIAGITPGTLPTSRWPPGYRAYKFTPYQWPGEALGERESPELLKHFEVELVKLGVKLGENGFDVRDVRGQDRLSFQCRSATSTLAFSGGTDAVVTPYGEEAWEMQICELIDWKTPQSLAAYNSNNVQQKLKLLGALHHSHRPAIVIFTDLTNFVIYQPFGKSIRYFHTFAQPAYGRISTDDAMRFIAYHLSVVTSTERVFHYEQLEFIPEDDPVRQMGAPLLAAKKLAGAGEGLVEQLSIVEDLPPEERLEAAAETILAWRPQLSYFA